MSSIDNMFGPQNQRIAQYSDHDRQALRHKILGGSPALSDSMYMNDLFNSNTMLNLPLFEDPKISNEQLAPLPLQDLSGGFHGLPLEWAAAVDNNQPLFEDNYFQLDTTSSVASYAPSQFDTESYVQSPTSPTFSAVMSACSAPQSVIMSPQMSAQDGAATPPAMADYDSMSEPADSDEVLENLLIDLEPADNGKYRCVDVEADGHVCDFEADRKCMLRKHLESTLKTNICRHPDCNGVQFSSKAVLTRHEKEAHGMHAASQYFCPVSTCERHARGFPREYNMGDHIQRVHRDIDVNLYLKKSKRSRKASSASGSGISSTPVASYISASAATKAAQAGIRKQSSAKARRDRTEKQYRLSRDAVVKLMFKMPEASSATSWKHIQQIKAEVAKLEEAHAGLYGHLNGVD